MTCAKTIIPTSHDCGSAEWINFNATEIHFQVCHNKLEASGLKRSLKCVCQLCLSTALELVMGHKIELMVESGKHCYETYKDCFALRQSKSEF